MKKRQKNKLGKKYETHLELIEELHLISKLYRESFSGEIFVTQKALDRSMYSSKLLAVKKYVESRDGLTFFS